MFFSRLLGLSLAALQALPAWSAGRADLFDAMGDFSGTPANLSLSASVIPAPGDANRNGAYFIAMLSGTQLLLLTPAGWVPFDGSTIPSYTSGGLGARTFPLLVNTDLSAAECEAFIAGYGYDANDMLVNGLFRVIYQVPAHLPRTTALPCSSMADADIARFLEQASFGPTDASIAEVKRLGLSGWIENQFTLPRTGYGDWPYVPEVKTAECTADGVANSTASLCARDNYTLFPLQLKFFQNALTAPDQLRQRVAFALSQMLVISATAEYLVKPYAFAPYQHMLMDNAFGNFETLLTKATLSPAMGYYLDMVQNGKPTAIQAANENYARELLQLFSIGLFKLNPDGSQQLDANGLPIASYDENTIKGFARTFTGWTYPVQPGATPKTYNPPYYIGDMVAIAGNHDNGSKQLLDTAVLPANQSPEKDLSDAIHNVFMHPNVGPFIGKQLIQHLVSSNPSPAYVARVAAVFNNNGANVRGDMKAVIRAILLDPEARGGMRTEADYGHLREPALMLTHLYRALGGVSDGLGLRNASAAMAQNIYYAPTVFNYFPADNRLLGGQSSPESGIQNSATALARANFIYSAVYGTSVGVVIYEAMRDVTVAGGTGTYLDLAPLMQLAPTPALLVDRLNTLLTHGTMAPETQTAIINAITAAGTDAKTRTQLAIYLVANSPQFMVER